MKHCRSMFCFARAHNEDQCFLQNLHPLANSKPIIKFFLLQKLKTGKYENQKHTARDKKSGKQPLRQRKTVTPSKR